MVQFSPYQSPISKLCLGTVQTQIIIILLSIFILFKLARSAFHNTFAFGNRRYCSEKALTVKFEAYIVNTGKTVSSYREYLYEAMAIEDR